jgi:hypothetical protein
MAKRSDAIARVWSVRSAEEVLIRIAVCALADDRFDSGRVLSKTYGCGWASALREEVLGANVPKSPRYPWIRVVCSTVVGGLW